MLHYVVAAAEGAEAALLNLSLQRRIAVFVSCVVLALVLAFAFLGWQAVTQSTDATLQERRATAVVTARQLDEFVADAQASLSVVASELVDRHGELDRGGAQDLLERSMPHTHLFYANLTVLDPDAEIVAAVPPSSMPRFRFSPAAQSIMVEALRSGLPSVSTRLQAPLAETDGILFVVPIQSSERVVGLIAGVMPLPHSSISGVASSLELGQTGHMQVIDADGHVLAARGSGADDVEDEVEHPDFYAALWASHSVAVGRAYSSHEQEWHIMAFAPLTNAPWGVGVGQTEAETFAAAASLRDRILSTTAVALALTLCFAWIGTQSVVKPVRALTRAGERMATGDLSQPILLIQPDEVGRLAQVLETVRQRLRHSLDETARWNRRLEQRVRKRTRELETSNRYLQTMMAVATAANAGTDHEVVLRTALKELVDTLEVRGGWVSLYNEDHRKLRMVTRYQVPKAIWSLEASVGHPEAACMQSLGSSDVRCQILEQCPLVANREQPRSAAENVDTTPNLGGSAPGPVCHTKFGRDALPETSSFGRTSGGSATCWSAPIRMDDQALGVLVLVSHRRQSLDTEAVALLQGVAQQIGMAFQKARLAEDRARLEAARRMEVLRGELLASVSHELRTPLGFIKGYATTLRRDDVQWNAAQQAEFLQIIDEETDHLTQLVDSVLDIARAQAGRMKLTCQPVELEQIARRSVERMNGSLAGRDVHIRSEDVPCIEADRSRLEQVLLNLLQNAVKYSPSGSPIDVAISSADGEVGIAVLDRGVGIAQAEADRIFEPFYRTPGEATSTVDGSGLGLAVSRAIVEAHGGQIWAEPRDGGGTGIHLSLPSRRINERVEHAV
jgi:signal transduction histidine kinase